MESEVYSRTNDLIQKYLDFIQETDKSDLKSNLTIEKLVKLKSVLSNINNVLTLLATKAIANNIIDTLKLGEAERETILSDIDSKKASSNGFDIQIDSPIKILVEVKCNALINGKQLGAAQINGILEDARKLRMESVRHQKIKINTDDYVKIVAVVNFGDEAQKQQLIHQITHEYECRPTTNQPRKDRMAVKKHIEAGKTLEEICNTEQKDMVYLYVIPIDALEKELEEIKLSGRRQRVIRGQDVETVTLFQA